MEEVEGREVILSYFFLLFRKEDLKNMIMNYGVMERNGIIDRNTVNNELKRSGKIFKSTVQLPEIKHPFAKHNSDFKNSQIK